MLPFQTREPFVDGTFYLSTLHSLYIDGDVDLRDEAEFFPWLGFYTRDGTPPPGGLRNPFPLGTSLMWAPFYAAFDVLYRVSGESGITEDTGPRAAPAYFATTFWIVIGLFVLADLLGRLGAGRLERTAIPVLAGALSPLPAYVTFAPDMSHGCGFAAAAILLSTCEWCYRTAEANSPRWLLCGLALGLLFMIRWQDATLGVLPALLILGLAINGSNATWSRAATGLAFLALGVAAASLPQLAAWKSVYGSWLLLPGNPQHLGEGQGFVSLANADPLAFLFSTWNGAFLSHPGMLLCIAGLALGWPEERGAVLWRWAVIAAVALQITSSMLVGDWWSGGSFGQRRMVSLVPLLAIGLQSLWRAAASAATPAAKGALTASCALLVLWNGLSLVRLHDGTLPYNPSDPSWYGDREPWDQYAYGRRFRELLTGVEQPEGEPRLRGPIRTR